MKNIDKIIKILSLTNSPRKEETIKNLIEYELFYSKGRYSNTDLINKIKNDFYIELLNADADDALGKLVSDNKTIRQNDKYKLNNKRELELNKIYDEEILKEQNRFARFSKFIDTIVDKPLEENQKKELASLYSEYLHECFYVYGSEVVNQFNPFVGKKNIFNDDENLLKKISEKIESQELKTVFLKIVEEFPQKLEHADLEYLQSLADKTECFLALGLSKELYEEFSNLKIIDWTILLDTNVIYCILGLDIVPDSEASRKLVELINNNNVQIKFRYLPQTLKELKKKKHHFESSISRIKFTSTQIKALLKSKQLDKYTQYYFEQKLKDPEYPHPADIIDLASKILSKKDILVYQGNFDSLVDNKKYLIEQYEKFILFIRKKNEKTRHKKIEKSSDKIEHDIFLREAILSLRNNQTVTLKEIKYFGISLDKILIAYDKSIGRSTKSSILIPTFFSPSFLLQKLTTMLPVIADDYKSAFIAAISSPAFDTNNENSVVVQKSVEYFHKLGIEDGNFILQCITDEYFLEEFENKAGTNEFNEFIQSEIDSYIQRLKDEKANLESDLYKKEKDLKEKDKLTENQLNTIVNEKNKILELNEKLSLTNEELEKLKVKISLIENQPQRKLDLVESDLKEEKIQYSINEDSNHILLINWKLLFNKLENKVYYASIITVILQGLLLILSFIISKSFYFIGILTLAFALSSIFIKGSKKIIYILYLVLSFLLSIFIWFNKSEILFYLKKFIKEI